VLEIHYIVASEKCCHRPKKKTAPSKDQNPLGGCVLPKMMAAGLEEHDQNFALGFMGKTWLFPSITQPQFIDGTFIIFWDMHFSVTPGKSRSRNSPKYHLISIAVSSS